MSKRTRPNKKARRWYALRALQPPKAKRPVKFLHPEQVRDVKGGA